MAEWLNVPPWKGGILERVSRVRIPVSPPAPFLEHPKTSKKLRKTQQMQRLFTFV
jgi:hypothetical protein